MAGLFLSYRRDDSQGYAGRLADDLSDAFGDDRVFSDIEIPAGSDFTEVLTRAVAGSDALLVVIGRRWAATSQAGFPSRLHEPGDWVATEVEAALTQGKPVLPLLVGGAEMPTRESLPERLHALVRRQAAELSDRHWDTDVAQLVARLRAMLPVLAAPPTPASDGDSALAQALREIAKRVGQAPGQRAPTPTPPPPAAPPAPAAPSWAWRLLRPLLHSLGRGLRRIVVLTLVAGLVYGGLRLFGDRDTLRQLDAVEQRLLIGWERLQRMVSPAPPQR